MNQTTINIDAARQSLIDSIRLISEGKNEQVIRDSFTSHLRQIFPQTPNWVLRHIHGSEAAVKILKESKGRTGFVDNLVDLTAIEYEGNLTVNSKYNTGYNQVKDYVASLVNQGHNPELIVGLLSDTVRWYAYTIDIEKLSDSPASRDNIILKEVEVLDCSKATDKEAGDLTRFLIKYLGRIGARPVTADSIAGDLGFRSRFCEPYLLSLTTIVSNAFDTNPKYANLISELWCNFVSYLREEGKSDQFDLKTYVDEYYILTIGKLICANYLERRALSSTELELETIINGSFFENKGLLNFVEYDYFGWLNSTDHLHEILPLAKAIQQDLVAYNFTSDPGEDLFGKLMAQLADRSQRLLLGQEWTPGWLSNKLVSQVVANLTPDEPLRLIDMCCGSGSMIIETLEIAKQRILLNNATSAKEHRIHLLTESITGFDIDPLAVMLSKINWVLKVKDWLQPLGAYQISIPIYHADSLFAITPISNNMEQNEEGFYSLKIAEHSINLPSFLITPAYHSFFDNLIDIGYRLVVSNKLSTPISIDRTAIKQHLQLIQESVSIQLEEKQLEDVLNFFTDFIDKIDALNRDGRNGIWSYILRNSFRPGLVSGQFNGLVSNPPWLALSKVADNPYQYALKKMADEFGIKPAGSSHLHIELATIFLLYAIRQYLVEGAKIGCIVPDTILNGHHHNRFRTAQYNNASKAVHFDIDEIWKVQEHAFKNNAIVLFGTKKFPLSNETPITGKNVFENGDGTNTFFYRNIQGNRTAWSEQDLSGSSEGFYIPANFRQGADIMPRNMLFYETAQSLNSQQYDVKSINRSTSPIAFTIKDAKKFQDFIITPRVLPKKLFFNVITSNLLTPFDVGEYQKALLPIKKNSQNVWVPLSTSEIAFEGAIVQNTFDFIARTIDPQSPTVDAIYQLIDTRGKLRQQVVNESGYIVMTGAGGGKVCSSYIDISGTDYSRLILDQTVYWTQVQGEDEALYLTGLLNSEAINSIIEDFQPRGAFGKRHVHKLPFGVTPPYDVNQASHKDVVAKTRALLTEYAELKTSATLKDLLNPNLGTLSRRRKLLAGFIKKLNSYKEYEESCRSLYGL